nr:hypothetical protein [Tanacetum cinerariifolium]
MKEYIKLEEEKACRRALSCEPMISPLNDNQIDFRISFDESDDEDYTVIYDKNLFSNKIISVDDLKMNSENDNDKVNMPLFPSPKPTVSYFNDLDFFKDLENEFSAIVYNDALTSKLDFLTEPAVSPQRIDEFNLKNKTSLSECDEEEQNVLYFNDLFIFNVINPDDSKSNKDIDDDKIDIEQPSRGAALGTKSIWNLTCRVGGSPGKSSGKTSEKSRTIGTSSSRFSFGLSSDLFVDENDCTKPVEEEERRHTTTVEGGVDQGGGLTYRKSIFDDDL